MNLPEDKNRQAENRKTKCPRVIKKYMTNNFKIQHISPRHKLRRQRPPHTCAVRREVNNKPVGRSLSWSFPMCWHGHGTRLRPSDMRSLGTELFSYNGTPMPNRKLGVAKRRMECVKAAKAKIAASFPFTSIVGQEEMKLSLILNVIDPKIGGVMIMGDRGTGKSTTVRALVDLLPEIDVVTNDPFNSDPNDLEGMSDTVRELMQRDTSQSSEPSLTPNPYGVSPNTIVAGETRTREGGGMHGEATKELRMSEGRNSIEKTTPKKIQISKAKIPMVDLPLGATEDRVCGTIDIEKALTEGVKAFEPGLLAKANRGILYVDEVNLLDDHLVDVLLDSAASGWNTVEREGVSIRHPARFILVGSGNPEEGELRPQLLDRFGMHAQIGTVRDPELRVKIVDQRTRFDENPQDFQKDFENSQNELRLKIVKARELLPKVELDYEFRINISKICSELKVDGLRGDIVTSRAAKALCAFEGRTKVTQEDIFRIISLTLSHRLRKDPLAQMDNGSKVLEIFNKVWPSL